MQGDKQTLRPTFWAVSVENWFKILNSAPEGLSAEQVKMATANKKGERNKQSPLTKDIFQFLGQFKSPLMLLLIGAVVISAFLGDTSDVFIILFIVLSTGIMSFIQERNAGKVVEKLQSMISLKSLVLRDGIAVEIETKKVVEGDVLLLNAGDMISVDCLLIEANELHVNEASLTGESFPVRKETGVLDANTELSKRLNCLWEGSNIVSGTAKALVINTGSDTVFGEIVKAASTTVETSFEKGIRFFGFFLMRITLVLAVFILTVNLLNHKSLIESGLFALALAVGMAPELLPAITTIAMSVGAKRMLDKKVIVKKLASIQNLGEVNLLCTDKTGTITEGAILVSGVKDISGEESEYAKELAYWNAYFESGYANPIDEALKKMSLKTQLNPTKLAEVPYDFIRKRLSILIQTEQGNKIVSKGAYNQILEICTHVQLADGSVALIDKQLESLNTQYEKYGLDGFRSIAVCYKNTTEVQFDKSDEANMVFAGFVLLEDPIKDGIVAAIEQLRVLGVKLKIISGDNKNVATAIALQLGISNPVVYTGQEIANMSPEAMHINVNKAHIFAEVEPHQKERIVQTLRKSFSIAYMGDGINDVSALNAADVGISVENAVDVAKEAADFVLMEKDLMVLTEGIKEGRKTFANTLKYIFINTGSTFGNMISVAFASLLLPFLPMLPKQILLTNFITDFPYLSVASDNVDEEQLDKPGKWDMKFIRNYMIIFGLHSSIFDACTFLTLYYGLKVKESAFQTGWFIESILTELFILFIIRTRKNFFRSRPGKTLFWLSILGFVMTLALPYSRIAMEVGLVPLPLNYLGMMLVIVAAYIITADMLKVWFFKKSSKPLA